MSLDDNVERKVMIAPSILSADFVRLAEEIAEVEKAGADLIHLDIMDGHFVPNITFGPRMVESIRKITKLPLDVHLMIAKPEKFIPQFVEAGSDIITVHLETSTHLHRNIYAIKNANVKAGVSINPHNPAFLLDDVLEDTDLVLVMSVNPGFGGQSFIDRALHKITSIRDVISESNLNVLIEVDGGINDITGKACRDAGADILVAGNYIFSSGDYKQAIESLR
jgi:ribulose-phosphate 3-epimerase